MRIHGSTLRISVKDLIDWREEAGLLEGQDSGLTFNSCQPFQNDMVRGKFEGYAVQPGFAIFLLDLMVNQDTEIMTEVNESRVGFSMILEGSCVRSAKDNRGHFVEKLAHAGLNVATTYHSEKWSLRLKGGQSHKLVKLRLARQHAEKLLAGWEEDLSGSLEQMLFSSELENAVFKKSLSFTLQNIGKQVVNCSLQGPIRRLFMEGKALEILAYELDEFSGHHNAETRPVSTTEIGRLYEARKIVEEEFADPPSLFDLACRVGLNDFKLKRGFREVFGTTVFEYVRKLRMEKARELLEEGRLSVTEVALTTGYSHFGHFSAAFKKSFGILPSRYRTTAGKPPK